MCMADVRLTRRQTLLAAIGGMLTASIPDRARAGGVSIGDDLTVNARSSWGTSFPPLPGLTPEPDVRFLLVHHTAGRNEYSSADVPRQIREVYAYHTGPAKQWPDVCYNFFIDRFGGVWEGRAGSLDGPVMADATGGSQGFAQLVCLLGNYHTIPPSPEMMNSLVRTLAWLAQRYELDTTPGATTQFVSRGSNLWPEGSRVSARIISGHRDMSQTVCPGDFVYPLLEDDVPAQVHSIVTAVRPTSSSEVPDTSSTSTTSELPRSTASSAAPPSNTTSSLLEPRVGHTVTSDDDRTGPDRGTGSAEVVHEDSSGEGKVLIAVAAGAAVTAGLLLSRLKDQGTVTERHPPDDESA